MRGGQVALNSVDLKEQREGFWQWGPTAAGGGVSRINSLLSPSTLTSISEIRLSRKPSVSLQ